MGSARLDVTPFAIPFRRPFVTASGTILRRAGLLVRLCDRDGHTGIGEASPHPTAAPEVLCEALASLSGVLQNAADPQAVLARIDNPIARAGLEMALYDLKAQVAAVRVVELLRVGAGTAPNLIPVNATLDASDPQQAAEFAAALVAEGYRCIKVKIGSGDIAGEETKFAAIRRAVGDDVMLRADANAAWNYGEAIAAITRLGAFGLEYIEQPVRDIADLARLRRVVSVPIAADESVTGPDSVREIAARGAADVIIVKPTLLGLTAAAAVVRTALGCGLRVVVTSTLDTSVGIAAALQIAALLPEPVPPCGLATLSLLGGDLAENPLVPANAQIALPVGNGLGVRIDESALARWKVSL